MRKDKNLAIQLRKQGKSYNEIARILKAPKSTLSFWLRNVKMPPEIEKRFWHKTRKKWARTITQFNKQRARETKQKAEKFQRSAAKDIGAFSKRELFLIGTALYWAEGYKKRLRWTLQFCNSDPAMIKLIMRFFKETCNVPKEKMRASAQIHPNVTPEKAINYWSRITGISKKQFTKTYSQISSSSKQKRPPNTLPYGTLRITIYDTQIANKVKGWIEGIAKQL